LSIISSYAAPNSRLTSSAMNILNIIFLFVLLVVSGGMVQAQSEMCSLTTFWVDKAPFSSSSRHLVGEFPLIIDEEPIVKLLRHADSGINVSIGVDVFKGIFKGEPSRIGLAIAFRDKSEAVFDDVEHSEAESVYDKNWRWLSVSKSVQVEKRIYTFTFGCERKTAKKSS
jgi:hypothetical protein